MSTASASAADKHVLKFGGTTAESVRSFRALAERGRRRLQSFEKCQKEKKEEEALRFLDAAKEERKKKRLEKARRLLEEERARKRQAAAVKAAKTRRRRKLAGLGPIRPRPAARAAPSSDSTPSGGEGAP